MSDPAAMDPSAPPAIPDTPAPAQLTSEGKRFMIELALKALAFDPHNMADADKGIFDEEVTAENGEDILKRIQNITAGSGVEPAIEDEGGF